jgi:hypothetical protein
MHDDLKKKMFRIFFVGDWVLIRTRGAEQRRRAAHIEQRIAVQNRLGACLGLARRLVGLLGERVCTRIFVCGAELGRERERSRSAAR